MPPYSPFAQAFPKLVGFFPSVCEILELLFDTDRVKGCTTVSEEYKKGFVVTVQIIQNMGNRDSKSLI